MRAACLLLPLLALLASGSGAAGQQKEEPPVGWPYRPEKSAPSVPMPVKPPAPDPAQMQAPQEQAGAGSAPDPGIGDGLPPLEHVLLPLAPFRLDFAIDRLTLDREETNWLRRLAERLRAGSESIRVLSRATASDGDMRAALERALARGLLVRDMLIDEGVALRRIAMEAEPLPADAGGEESLSILRADPVGDDPFR